MAQPYLSALISTGDVLDESSEIIPSISATVKFLKGNLLDDTISISLSKDQQPIISLQNLLPGAIVILELNPSHSGIRDLPPMDNVLRIIESCDLYDFNVLLYRCAPEENDGNTPRGTYTIPGYGALPYAGLQGFMTAIRRLELDPSDHHPLSENIRQGDWALEYISSRLNRSRFPHLVELSNALNDCFAKIISLPPMAKPLVFVEMIKYLFAAASEAALGLMDRSIMGGDQLTKELALTSVQLAGEVDSTGLHPSIVEPCLSAGLPYFSTHHMRCWGRDVFISLPGLLLYTGRYSDARRHILAFASCYYRGLIPNLLDSGRRPRYNARDATWWFLYAVQSFCRLVPDGRTILDVDVPLRFPDDIYIDYDDPSIYKRSRKLKDIVQGIMEAHAKGIKFREWNAGPSLDSLMRDQGFNIEIYLDLETGFIHGGNAFNCGTWMDKMGESEKAGNRGVPATPRDGAAIELIALLASTLDWLASDNPTCNPAVDVGNGTILSYSEWKTKLVSCFERYFYIPDDDRFDSEYKIDPKIVRSRGIYKDTFGSSNAKHDYQLRPNMIVALSIAPWLFDKAHATIALCTTEQHLVGPLGLRTLSPDDPDYRPYYDNVNDSDDSAVAKGFNYHQGPEWLWLMGCYLKAWLQNVAINDRKEAINMIMKRIVPLSIHLRGSEYCGLAELTNKDGEYCRDSCQTQAWSSGTVLEVLLNLPDK